MYPVPLPASSHPPLVAPRLFEGQHMPVPRAPLTFNLFPLNLPFSLTSALRPPSQSLLTEFSGMPAPLPWAQCPGLPEGGAQGAEMPCLRPVMSPSGRVCPEQSGTLLCCPGSPAAPRQQGALGTTQCPAGAVEPAASRCSQEEASGKDTPTSTSLA